MRSFFVFLFLGWVLISPAQSSRLNTALKMKLCEKNVPEERFTILVQGDISRLKAFEKQAGYSVNYSAGDIASVNCNATAISFMLEHRIISYAELITPHITPMNDTMVYRNRIKPVKQGDAPLSQAYNGAGILLGFIDTGIDIAHPDFKDAQGNTRIRYLWDQKASSGSSAPGPFAYGMEWTEAQINAGLCTHSDMPYYGHGTHVSGIAAGNGLANHTHEGCAPEADIVMVAIDFNHAGAATADAVQYIFDKATQLGKPCVINSSVGDYYGSHDATNLEAKLIENMVANTPGRVMVAAAGNAGYIRHHVKTQNAGADTSFTWLMNNSSSLDYWFYGDTSQVKNLEISVGANRLSFSDLGRIPFRNHNYGLSAVQQDTLKHNGNRIGIVYNASGINNYGVYELYLHIKADTAGLLWRVETKGSGLHHAWNFDFVSSGLPTLAQYPRIASYVMPDTMYSLVTSYQCSDEVITVANYVNLSNYYDVRDTLEHTGDITGALAWSSSSGPTRDGRLKPDITATGHNVFSALVTGMRASQIASSPQTVAQGSFHVIGGGTSASSPVVAGLAALYLQAHPDATNQQVKRAITHCAYTDMFTGSVPNYAWGYGKLDGKAAMVCEENLVSIRKPGLNGTLSYYPNPFRNKVTIEFPSKAMRRLYVYTTDGRLIYQDQCVNQSYELDATHLEGIPASLLLVKISGTEENYTLKLILE